MRLDGKIALVTGGGSGIGKDISLRFAGVGSSVAVMDIDEETARATVDEIRKHFPEVEAVAIRCDVSIAEDVRKAVAAARDAFGCVNILVNNAGIRIIGSLADTSDADWERTIAINLSGIFHFCKHVVPEMTKQGRGKIVNIASIAGLSGFPNRVAYCASKGGVIGLTRALAMELAPKNINVNAIAPGIIETPMTTPYFQDTIIMQFINHATALGRWGDGMEIADAALYLSSDLSDYVTGITLPVDGGYLCGKK